MADTADDLEALFDEVAAQHTSTVTDNEPVPPIQTSTVELPESTSTPTSDTSFADQSDKPMYERLGGIVRLLHDSLRELGYDRSLSDMASQINDVQDRLEYVASLTEQAANKVLNAVDASMPAQDALSKTAKDMESRWQALFTGNLGIEEFKALASDSRQFAATVASAAEAEKARLLEIMMAQDFQDITGQLIKKIVMITHVAEHELAQLLRDNAPAEIKAAMASAEQKPIELMNGPAMPAAAMQQDGVDDLLDSLGF